MRNSRRSIGKILQTGFDQLGNKTDQLVNKTDQLVNKTDQLVNKTDQLGIKTDQLSYNLKEGFQRISLELNQGFKGIRSVNL
jgi:X-X-X-Leu-X-X-Gly heptad repeat protein